jgi:hypothetical protein
MRVVCLGFLDNSWVELHNTLWIGLFPWADAMRGIDIPPFAVIRRFRTIISFNLTYLVGVYLEVETRDYLDDVCNH